jgi:hypothetical protein
MPDLPRWVTDLIIVLIVCWFIDREVGKLKAWIEGLVASKNQGKSEQNDARCLVCGKPWSEDYADCPACGRHWTADGMCGTRWTEIALRTTAERTNRVEIIQP